MIIVRRLLRQMLRQASWRYIKEMPCIVKK